MKLWNYFLSNIKKKFYNIEPNIKHHNNGIYAYIRLEPNTLAYYSPIFDFYNAVHSLT